MKIYHLHATQFLPISLAEAWDFFSSPRNLQKITPSEMNFEILSITQDKKVYAGQLIEYNVSVLPFLRVRWVTEITQVSDLHYFIDEQRFGPYSLWHHQHHFQQVDGGVEMIDEVSYALPLGILGRMAHWFFVKREVKNIFDYRKKILDEFFKK